VAPPANGHSHPRLTWGMVLRDPGLRPFSSDLSLQWDPSPGPCLWVCRCLVASGLCFGPWESPPFLSVVSSSLHDTPLLSVALQSFLGASGSISPSKGHVSPLPSPSLSTASRPPQFFRGPPSASPVAKCHLVSFFSLPWSSPSVWIAHPLTCGALSPG